MSDFIIPKGAIFTFTIAVKERDSFLAQDLTNMSSAVITVFEKADTSCIKFTSDLVVSDALNGILKGTLSAFDTGLLTIDRGPKVDGYYLKPLYYASIAITFTDGTLPISVLIEDVYAGPEGVVCA